MAETPGGVFSQAVKIWLQRWIAPIHHLGASGELPEARDARLHLWAIDKAINKVCNLIEIAGTSPHRNQSSKLSQGLEGFMQAIHLRAPECLGSWHR